ncbi:MAG: class I SAM-dependent methyltransferase [Patescibacteria group bacterium]
MNLQTIKILLEKTKEDYEELAEIFSHTRKNLWEDLKGFDQYVKNGDKILDLGCGNGRVFELFKNKKIDYIGVDNCKKLIDIARKKYRATDATFFVRDALYLPFEELKFDVVFCIATLNHIPSKKLQIRVLENIKRVLKKDGILIMTNWNLYQGKYFLFIVKSFFQKIISFFSKKKVKLDFGDLLIPWKLKDKTIRRYYHAFTMNELSQRFKQVKFNVIEKYYTKKGKKTNWWKGYNLVFIAKKD